MTTLAATLYSGPSLKARFKRSTIRSLRKRPSIGSTRWHLKNLSSVQHVICRNSELRGLKSIKLPARQLSELKAKTYNLFSKAILQNQFRNHPLLLGGGGIKRWRRLSPLKPTQRIRALLLLLTRCTEAWKKRTVMFTSSRLWSFLCFRRLSYLH